MSTVRTTFDDAYIANQIGRWSTFAGVNPDADELVDAAEAILDGQDSTTERVAMQSLRYVWRRQDLPHGSTWKDAEGVCEEVLEVVR